MPRASRAIRGVRGCMRCAASRCPSSSSTTRRCRLRRCGPARDSSRRRSWPRRMNAMRSCCQGFPVPNGCNGPSPPCSAGGRYASPLCKDHASIAFAFRSIACSRSVRTASNGQCRSRKCSRWRTGLFPNRSGLRPAIGTSQNVLPAHSRACCSDVTSSVPTEASSPHRSALRVPQTNCGPQTNAARRGPGIPLKNACCLRARHPGRYLRCASFVESMDSTSLALLDLDPTATLSATQPFFNGLLAPPRRVRSRNRAQIRGSSVRSSCARGP